MRKLLPVFVLWSSVAFAQTTLPAGTELIVRLSTPVSSNSSKVDQVIEAVTITPVVDGSKVVLPTGVKVRGRVTETTPAVKPDERATIQVLFDDLGGAKTKGIVIDVDNARESVDATGKIIGILASETIAARIDQGIGKVAKRSAGFAGILEVAKGAVLTAPHPARSSTNRE